MTLMVAATPALASQPVPNDLNNCNIATPNPDAVACSGYWDQNLIAGDPTDLTAQHDALANIGVNGTDANDGTRVGAVFNWDTSTFNSLITGTYNSGTGVLSFGQTLYGLTYVGVHFGNANTGGTDRTVFYEFDFGTGGQAGITLNDPGYSNSVLYTTGTPAVPEPATWAMMLLGFGGVGAAMRRGRKSAGLLQVA